jgi:hypothetical protein
MNTRTAPRAELLAILRREHQKAHRQAVQHLHHCMSRTPDGRHCCPRGRDLDERADQIEREIVTAEGGWM